MARACAATLLITTLLAATAAAAAAAAALDINGDTSMLESGTLKQQWEAQGPDPTPAAFDTSLGQARTWVGDMANRLALSPRMATMEAYVTPKGYALEEHEVTTKDGYIGKVYRIPRGRGAGNASKPGPPVLLLHGISLSSVCWVVNDPDQSLAFILADKGHDVWMFNTRGNTFSRGHKKYGTLDTRYWRFAMDEMAVIDLPATILYMLQVTGYSQVSMVGHSQGGTLAVMMLAHLPHFNRLVSVNVGLAPVTYVRDITSPNMVAFCRLGNVSHVMDAVLPPSEHFPMGKPIHDMLLNGLCQIQPLTSICVDVTVSLFGKSTHIVGKQYRKYWLAWPSSTSYWNALHWSQMYNDPEPRLFQLNYGPEYFLQNITTPTILLTGGVDVLAPPAAMDRMRKVMGDAGSLAGWLHTPDYGHMDFIWDAKSAKTMVYPFVADALQRYSSTNT